MVEHFKHGFVVGCAETGLADVSGGTIDLGAGIFEVAFTNFFVNPGDPPMTLRNVGTAPLRVSEIIADPDVLGLTFDAARKPLRQTRTAFDGFYILESVPPGQNLLRICTDD